MAVVCFDSSAFVKLLVEEAGSEIAARLWDEADVVVASRLAFPEVRATLAAARRAARLDEASERRARRDWDEFWSATRVVELTAEVATDAATLAGRHVLGGADAVHLASAMTMVEASPILAVWDARLRTAAVQAGLVVAPREAVPRGVVGNESVGVIVDVGVAAGYPASSSLVLGPTSLSSGASLSFS